MSGNLAGVLRNAKMAHAAEAQAIEEQRPVPKPEPVANTPVSSKPLGKYRDPDFRKVTIYLRDSTRKAALTKLIHEDQDMSGVVDLLLDGWTTGKIKL